MSHITPGIRISLRGEDFLVTKTEGHIIEAEGLSELVKSQRFQFDLHIEDDYSIITPENTGLIADDSNHYRKTKLFIETTLRNSSSYSDDVIEIAHKAAIMPSNYQFVPTFKALSLPKPRILIADAVGLGKTIQVGIFLAEMLRRGKGQKILVVTPKAILGQFQREIWSRFSIPLVRLDSQGVARIKEKIPQNKNPFDYYDKVIISIDTLKNNGRFRHFLEKTRWDIIVIDECHNVANTHSQRGDLARFLSGKTESLVLTSATPHNGRRENFANLISLLDRTAIPANGEFTREDIAPLYVRRFKKDIESEVGDAFRDRVTEPISAPFFTEEEEVLRTLQEFRRRAYAETGGKLSSGNLLFAIQLFKSYMSSPSAFLQALDNRLGKTEKKEKEDNPDRKRDEQELKTLLTDLRRQTQEIIDRKLDGKYNNLLGKLKAMKWKGRQDDERIIIFSERRATLDYLERRLREDFKLKDAAVVQFNGSLTDIQQQDIIDNFSKEDSPIRLFLTSDAGSQGVNLHYYCHRMFNYDIPWSIITLDQRNGRIDRFGQRETPHIYYLIAQSLDPAIQDDLRILERLREKEEEVHRSLGDAGSVWKLFDVEKEEERVAQALATGDLTLLDGEEQAGDADWTDIFGLSDADDHTDSSPTGDTPASIQLSAATDPLFFANDFEYYNALAEEIRLESDIYRQTIRTDAQAQLIEITPDKKSDINASDESVLYDIPEEAFPPAREVFMLTTRKEDVEKSIERARKKKGEWPAMQLLYDLHPIARWMQHKLLARIDKGNALVARMRDPLPEKSAWFVMQAISSNKLGRPVMSRSFVIGRSLIGRDVGNKSSFEGFLKDFRLHEYLPTLATEPAHLEILKSMIPDVVVSARKLFDNYWLGALRDEIENKLEQYEDKLKKWVTDNERQLELLFEDEPAPQQIKRKERRREDIHHVQQEMSAFYEEYFQLENDPHFRILAVFYNA